MEGITVENKEQKTIEKITVDLIRASGHYLTNTTMCTGALAIPKGKERYDSKVVVFPWRVDSFDKINGEDGTKYLKYNSLFQILYFGSGKQSDVPKKIEVTLYLSNLEKELVPDVVHNW